MRRTGTFRGRDEEEHLPSAENDQKEKELRAVQESAVENPVEPFELKDELAVCHRYECLRVPARAAPQLGLSVPARPPPDQRVRRLQTRTELLALGSRLQQDARSGGPELFPQLQLSQQLLSAAEERGERWPACAHICAVSDRFSYTSAGDIFRYFTVSTVCATDVSASSACFFGRIRITAIICLLVDKNDSGY